MAISSSPDDPLTVAVLGSARLERGTDEWDLAHALGQELGDRGWTVLTGGYGGLMGATAAGVRAAGGRTVGLPMQAWTHLEPDIANDELRWSHSYGQRLDHVIAADTVVALPGGVGTLSEWTLAWAAAQTETRPATIILLGERWARILDALTADLVVTAEDLQLVRLATDPAAVPDLILTGLLPRKAGTASG